MKGKRRASYNARVGIDKLFPIIGTTQESPTNAELSAFSNTHESLLAWCCAMVKRR